jgi:hypothetical protein
MSWESYDDKCRGCKPILIEASNGKAVPDDDPKMQVILAVFENLTLPERQAWHRFTCQNSRNPADLKIVSSFQKQIEDALGSCRPKEPQN